MLQIQARVCGARPLPPSPPRAPEAARAAPQVDTGQLSLDAYLDQLRAAVAKEKARFSQLKASGPPSLLGRPFLLLLPSSHAAPRLRTSLHIPRHSALQVAAKEGAGALVTKAAIRANKRAQTMQQEIDEAMAAS